MLTKKERPQLSLTFEPLKPGDVPATFACTDLLQEAVGFKPQTSIKEGLRKFALWYVGYYGVK